MANPLEPRDCLPPREEGFDNSLKGAQLSSRVVVVDRPQHSGIVHRRKHG